MIKKINEYVTEVVTHWGPTVSIIVTVILCTYTLFGEMKRLELRVDSQCSRTDRLYEMFIDLIKEGRSK